MQKRNYNELFVHVAMCTHKTAKDVLLISNKAAPLLEELAKYKNTNIKTLKTELDELQNEQDELYDIVLCEAEPTKAMAGHINRVLKKDGLATFSGFNLIDQESSTAKFKEIGKYFKIVMPYSLLGHNKAVLASKEYHPTADIILQRADLTDGYEVYNSDLHVALFAMPTYTKKTYLGVIKN